MDDEARKDILSEQVLSELSVIKDLVQDVPNIKTNLQVVRADVEVLKSDMTVVKAVQQDHSRISLKSRPT